MMRYINYVHNMNIYFYIETSVWFGILSLALCCLQFHELCLHFIVIVVHFQYVIKCNAIYILVVTLIIVSSLVQCVKAGTIWICIIDLLYPIVQFKAHIVDSTKGREYERFSLGTSSSPAGQVLRNGGAVDEEREHVTLLTQQRVGVEGHLAAFSSVHLYTDVGLQGIKSNASYLFYLLENRRTEWQTDIG